MLALLYDAIRSAKGLKVSRGKMDHNADHWIEATLASLIQKKLLRQTLRSKQRFLVATEKGESQATKLAGLSTLSLGNGRDKRSKSGVSATASGRGRKRHPVDEWFPVAVNLLKDGVSDRQIAARLRMSHSTLAENPRFKNAKRVFAAPDNRPRHFEKRHGERRELPRDRCGAIDTSEDESSLHR